MKNLSDVVIRDAEHDDVETLHDFMLRTSAESAVGVGELYEAVLDSDDTVTIALSPVDGSVIGVLWYTPWEYHSLGIHVVAVEKSWRNMGLGTKLINMADPESLGLEYSVFSVSSENFKALKFLSDRGFIVTKVFEFADEEMYILRKTARKSKPIELTSRLRWRHVNG
tara:strand:+ start:40 stop:543 length:504 start_codon:yes stop_codon:yes gene_type:complete